MESSTVVGVTSCLCHLRKVHRGLFLRQGEVQKIFVRHGGSEAINGPPPVWAQCNATVAAIG